MAWRLERFTPAIDAMLTEDTTAPRKQRQTARRLLHRRIEEHTAEELSYSTVRDYVRVRRAQIDMEAGHRAAPTIGNRRIHSHEADPSFQSQGDPPLTMGAWGKCLKQSVQPLRPKP